MEKSDLENAFAAEWAPHHDLLFVHSQHSTELFMKLRQKCLMPGFLYSAEGQTQLKLDGDTELLFLQHCSDDRSERRAGRGSGGQGRRYGGNKRSQREGTAVFVGI